jgi:nicotinate-nucleotide--dimethylbenzimidazole phosphoribosyltransferase
VGLLEKTLTSIGPLDERAAASAQERLDSLTKPLGSLGYLEEIVRRYAAIRHDPKARLGRRAITVFVADHGIAAEGVSAYPKSVTLQMLRNIARGGAAISVIARASDYSLTVIDVGVEIDTSADPIPGVRYRRIGAGTANFLRGPAMSIIQVRAAIEAGIEAALTEAADGATLIGLGEMGIGNSTAAAAVLANLTDIEAARLIGRGTGLDDRGLQRKLEVVKSGLRLHHAPRGDPIATLAAVGGFEIAAMTGACLGAAAERIPVVVDGFIATAGAVAAERLHPGIHQYLFFGHRSAESGHVAVLDAIGVRPILDLNIRLGEGVGAALAMKIIEAALLLFREMATFASAGVSGRSR